MINFKKLSVAHIKHHRAGFVSLVVSYDKTMPVPEPGQFFMLKTENRLIARPISVHNYFRLLRKGAV